jgi:hypothetical protein
MLKGYNDYCNKIYGGGVSRILFSAQAQIAIIHLGILLLRSSSDFERASLAKNMANSFLASGGVCMRSFLTEGRLGPKPSFSPCLVLRHQRFVFCYTFRSLAAPSLSLAPFSLKSRLSSP